MEEKKWDLLKEAILFAAERHGNAPRKGKEKLYFFHPMEAASIVGNLTSDEEVIAAAVLHDTLEDTGTTPEELLERFGSRVLELVQAETEERDPGVSKEQSWQERKDATITRIGKASREERMICLGDKLSNIREIARDYDQLGEKLWERFNQKDPALIGKYYGDILALMEEEFGDIPETREYRRHLEEVFGKRG